MSILCIVGTRPEVIKVVPLFKLLKQRGLPVFLCITKQHEHMVAEVLNFFECTPDYTLTFDHQPTSLNDLFAMLLTTLDQFFKTHSFEWVFVQGDTATVCATTLAAFHNNIKIAHLEAGLRTYNLAAPFPEEGYRQMVSRLATLHYAPTTTAAQNLLSEHISANSIAIVGNTVIDAQHHTLEKINTHPELINAQLRAFCKAVKNKKNILFVLTAHRREAHGQTLETIFRTIATFLENHPHVSCVYTTHANPAIKQALLASNFIDENNNVRTSIASQVLFEQPLPQHDFMFALNEADFVVTDSGGIQEEAIALQKKIICVREITERPEGVEYGITTLVGADEKRITTAMKAAITNQSLEKNYPRNIYGDGTACEKIFQHFISFQNKSELPFTACKGLSVKGNQSP